MSNKSISITGEAITTLEREDFDFVAHGFARIFDEKTGRVREWLREPGLTDDEVRQMDAIYRARFPNGPRTKPAAMTLKEAAHYVPREDLSTDEELARIEAFMKNHRSAYFKAEKLQARYRELLGARETQNTLARMNEAAIAAKNIGQSGLA